MSLDEGRRGRATRRTGAGPRGAERGAEPAGGGRTKMPRSTVVGSRVGAGGASSVGGEGRRRAVPEPPQQLPPQRLRTRRLQPASQAAQPAPQQQQPQQQQPQQQETAPPEEGGAEQRPGERRPQKQKTKTTDAFRVRLRRSEHAQLAPDATPASSKRFTTISRASGARHKMLKQVGITIVQ